MFGFIRIWSYWYLLLLVFDLTGIRSYWYSILLVFGRIGIWSYWYLVLLGGFSKEKHKFHASFKAKPLSFKANALNFKETIKC